MDSLVWLGLMILFLIIESGTVSLVCIWFAAGSLAALIVSMFSGLLWLQALVFLVVSCILLALLRPLVRKYIKPNITNTNVDSVIGTEGKVTQAIDNVAATGQVKLGAMYWTARSENGDPIPEDTLIRVERIEGVKAFVVPAEVPATKS